MSARRSLMASPWRVRAVRTPVAGKAVDEAVPLLVELHRALDGKLPPCSADPAAWTSAEPADVAHAVAGCKPCTATAECAAYARAVRPRIGVWAGKPVYVRRTRHDDDTDSSHTEESNNA